jgi:hypothetical protein
MFTRRKLLAINAFMGMSVFLPSLSACASEQVLVITNQTMTKLGALRAEEKFTNLPGAPAAAERRRLEPLFNSLLDTLIDGLAKNPRKSWVLGVMEPVVERFHLEDTEARDSCVDYLERILSILEIQSTDGAFFKYMIFMK